MTAWTASPYRAIGVYVGGSSRTCAQPNLTSSWVSQVTRSGWRLIPIYKGLQPACGARPTDPKISLTLSTAASQGKSAADDAIAKGSALGMVAGGAFYLDIENYARGDTGCRDSVLTFVSSWTKDLHAHGYVSGVYMNLTLGATDLASVYGSTSYARPDALWVARNDQSTSLTGWAGITNTSWAVHQRAKQYIGGHNETYGGVTINIDNDYVDAPVATVRFAYTVTSTVPLNARSEPSTSYPVVHSYAPRTGLSLVCQAPGATVGTTAVWDRLADGTWVTDRYVSTPSKTTYSAPLPRCSYGYQVNAPVSVNTRTGPGTQYAVAGTIPNGGLASVACQAAGTAVYGTRVWDKLDTGRWVSDYYVANPSNTTYSGPPPRC